MDPTPEQQSKVTRDEVNAQVSEFFYGVTKTKHCPNAYSLKRPIDLVS